MGETLAERRAEFDSHVWNHAQDPFQLGFDQRPPLGAVELAAMTTVVGAVEGGASPDEVLHVLTGVLREDPRLILTVMQAVGLTRNKILTDLKGAGLRVPSRPDLLVTRPDVWPQAGRYLAARVISVFAPLVETPRSTWSSTFEVVNQATWPGWIRQERAKRQGHEAEGRIATLLLSLGLEFQPTEKAENPLCADVQVHNVSFDIVSPNASGFLVGFKSTVQTSNIGQFGESKGGLEVREAREMVDSQFDIPRPKVVAMVDGVGFFTNTAGLNEILEGSDEFCQFSTIWKAAVVVASAQGVRLDLVLLDPGEHDAFLKRYETTVRLKDSARGRRWVLAGEARIRRQESGS
jgi:hypothetical protein